MTFYGLTFQILNGWHMAALCLIIAGIMVFNSYQHRYKCLQRRIKAFIWIVLALGFLYDAIFDPAAVVIRPILRLMVFGVLIGEISYHSDVLTDMYCALRKRIRERRENEFG